MKSLLNMLLETGTKCCCSSKWCPLSYHYNSCMIFQKVSWKMCKERMGSSINQSEIHAKPWKLCFQCKTMKRRWLMPFKHKKIKYRTLFLWLFLVRFSIYLFIYLFNFWKPELKCRLEIGLWAGIQWVFTFFTQKTDFIKMNFCSSLVTSWWGSRCLKLG